MCDTCPIGGMSQPKEREIEIVREMERGVKRREVRKADEGQNG